MMLSACAYTESRAHVAQPGATQIWIEDEHHVPQLRLTPNDTSAEAVARVYADWPFNDDVMHVARRDDGSVVTLCEEPDCDGRRTRTLLGSDGWTMTIDDPGAATRAINAVNEVDLQFSYRTGGRSTTLRGWIRTPMDNVTAVETTRRPVFALGSAPSILFSTVGAFMIAGGIALAVPERHEGNNGARIAIAVPVVATGVGNVLLGLSELFYPTRTLTRDAR